MASLFSTLFGSNTPAPAPAAPVQKVAELQPSVTADPGNGTVPANSGNAPVTKSESPLGEFTNLWEAPTNADGTPIAPKDSSIFPNIDPAKVMASAGQIDFTKHVTKDQLTAIAAGGEGAVSALLAVLNGASQQAYGNSAMATAKIVESAITKAREQFTAEIPGLLKSQTAADLLRQENPVFSNPAAAPILESLQNQFRTKFPNDTPQQTVTRAKAYLNDFATAIQAPDVAAAQQKVNANSRQTDWSEWAS